MNIKSVEKAALDHAMNVFRDRSNELIMLFKTESLKMLEKYTFLRDEL